MAITRAQQYRQMLKDGSKKPVVQGGVENYSPSEMVTVPKFAKSAPDHPQTVLAYITKPEIDLIIKKDFHGSLKDGPNKGPGGLMSLNAGFNEPGGFQSGGNQSAAEGGDSGAFGEGADNQREAESVRAGALAAGAGAKDTDTDAIRKEAEEIKAASKARAAKQKADKEYEKSQLAKERAKDFKKAKDRDKDRKQKRFNAILNAKNKFGINTLGLTQMELADLKAAGLYDEKTGFKDPEDFGLLDSNPTSGLYNLLEKDDRFSGANQYNFENSYDSGPFKGPVLSLLDPFFKKGAKKTKEFFTDDVLGAGRFKYLGKTVTPDMFKMMSPSQMDEVYGGYMSGRQSGEIDAYGNPTNLNTGGGGGGDNNQTYVPPIIPEDDTEEEDATPSRNLGGLAPRFAGSIFDFDGLADGGRAGAMDGGRMMMMANEEEDDPTGGIMDLESGRQMYGLGKLVKKITRSVKKIAKSPIGKAALLYAGGSYLAGANNFFGGLKGSGILKSMGSGAGKGSIFSKLFGANNTMKGFANVSTAKMPGFLSKIGLTQGYGSMMPTAFGGILGASALTGLMTPKEEEEKFDDYYASNTIDYDNVRKNPFKFLSAANQGSMFAADGGLMRTGYAEGSEEPVAKKTMPLLDMDGQEMDLREEGGFVPLGRMERADDVPARLSKNEFVFTADAVRNAGEGDIDKGAEVMYNMMKNLESGGEVSEESQGLEGAREMFKTSQRLEEVI